MGHSIVDRMQKQKETEQIGNESHSEAPVSVRDVDYIEVNEEVNA
jgi:hypothetical protein